MDTRYASRYVTKGHIFATRSPDLQFKVSNVEVEKGWVTVPLTDKKKIAEKTKKKVGKAGSSPRESAKKTITQKKK